MNDNLNNKVEELNERLNDTLDYIKDIGNDIGQNLIAPFIKSNEKIRELNIGLLNSKDIYKDIAKINSEIAKNNIKDVELGIKKSLTEQSLSKAMETFQASANRQEYIRNGREVIRQKQKLKSLALQIELSDQLRNQLNAVLRIAEAEALVTEEKIRQNSFINIIKKSYEDNIKKNIETFTTLNSILNIFLKAALSFNSISVNLGKNFGYGADQADRLTSNLVSVAQNSNNLNVTLKNAAEAMNQLNESTGLVAEYSARNLETQIMLTKQFGLTGDEAAGLYKLSVLNGRSAEDINKSMVGAYVASRNQLKVGIPFKAVMVEAAKVSGQLAANLKNNPELLVQAVSQAKALGTTLEQTSKQGESLLDFESSIEAELRAELLTGQSLNLERARAAALMGDQVTVMKELNNQGMTLSKFQNMNVLSQKAFASAIGLSSDELANQLRQQQLAVESGKSLAQITEEEALEAQKRQDIQTKFNVAIEKLQDLIGNLVAGPLGTFLDMISSILSHTTALKVLMGGALFYNMLKLVKVAQALKMQEIGVAIGKAWAAAMSSPASLLTGGLAGAAIAGGLTAAILAATNNIPEMAEGGVIPATPGGRIVKVAEAGQPEAIIPLNKMPNIIAPKQDNTALIAAINRQTEVIASKNYSPVLRTTINGSEIATTSAQSSYNVA